MSLVLRLCWTQRDLSPGLAVLLLLRECEVFAGGPRAGSDFASSHAWLDSGNFHPGTRHMRDLLKVHMSETGRTVQPTSPWKLLRSASWALIMYSAGTSPKGPCRQHLLPKDRLHCLIAETFHLGEQKGCNQTTSSNLHQQMFLLRSSLNAITGSVSSLAGSNNSNRPLGSPQGTSSGPPTMLNA